MNLENLELFIFLCDKIENNGLPILRENTFYYLLYSKCKWVKI